MPDTKPPVPLAQNKIVQAVAGVALEALERAEQALKAE